MLVFITGGVRSGKSQFAERYANDLAGNEIVHYIATSHVFDEEMEWRKQLHIAQREKQFRFCLTHEVPYNIGQVFTQFQRGHIVLLDCITTWVANELFIDATSWQHPFFQTSVYEKVTTTIQQLKQLPIHSLIVSNELLHDIPYEDEGTFYYKQMLGRIHQAIVEQCDEAIVIENGLPIWKKGGKET
ncbi:bifunctional adenosylcobinamide kinase/adenosylcobinamide-phosphate guanylyltransferase [Alkalihalobacterium bogoriense]|uniref:bifunctional adenosylcobinamide kinase/adenosylcobinamide-phosphate guanylyltransferase n=1 Tax=Alkalihalobacterium bogoriense TaxID=246272 RepID=UPI0004787044|nr:bifunctional adenosylcobinamide kinase/adenosylcobinamide-phosphate guanylyltransferase [Alkalihalobacterium bogoriense]